MGQLLGPDFPSDIALAVSGGGDSMAMLYLAHNWTRVWGVRLWVVTVDHGLRPESAAEATMVAEECAALGWPHATLRWHWDGTGNKMDAARRARLALIDRWRGGIDAVLMAHTLDDVAETFLLRLARGSGVDGLAAMAAERRVFPDTEVDGEITGACPPSDPDRAKGFRLLRPCLDMARADLRHYLRTLHGRWVEDPSNDDPAYARVRVRRAQELLSGLGLDNTTLAATARRMARARDSLRQQAWQVWQEIGQEGRAGVAPTGELLMDRTGFEAAGRETQLRLLAAALQWIASDAYRPRAEPLEALLDRLLGGGGGTLLGCEARMERAQLRVFRELKAVQDLATPMGIWDTRWRVSAQAFHDMEGVEVRTLGDAGWQQVAEKPAGAPPHASARSLPALWQGDTLLACDALGIGPGGTSTLLSKVFSDFLLSH
ncbi:tRNA lysidine(34) synthetase TilS [Maliponia aquimaris]|uniref:tRNA(Ile)-lysidine synthase n=1 Tax=Maliponia aquimaris TaxID=1673631 RepID=A0A238KBH8_9RHOB|nr:tRNA lysidine(34) synthetase TilS [Maliponia aquimaris]SMX40198.1 tRNA(Ile)-lysidine synthase [Maliponia aquimaris]